MSGSFRGIGMTSLRTRDRLVRRLVRDGIRDADVLEAIRNIPRHIFVDEALATRAYEDAALPIGSGQTISQPYVVARMTEALLAGGRVRKVLEIGSGCGYQTAVLAKLVDKVYSVERISGLMFQARERLYALGLHNVRMLHGDGVGGWSEHAPFDGIMVTAAPQRVPRDLLDQMAPKGRMVIPVGEGEVQRLMLISRSSDGYREQLLEQVSFVPMVAGTG